MTKDSTIKTASSTSYSTPKKKKKVINSGPSKPEITSKKKKKASSSSAVVSPPAAKKRASSKHFTEGKIQKRKRYKTKVKKIEEGSRSRTSRGRSKDRTEASMKKKVTSKENDLSKSIKPTKDLVLKKKSSSAKDSSSKKKKKASAKKSPPGLKFKSASDKSSKEDKKKKQSSSGGSSSVESTKSKSPPEFNVNLSKFTSIKDYLLLAKHHGKEVKSKELRKLSNTKSIIERCIVSVKPTILGGVFNTLNRLLKTNIDIGISNIRMGKNAGKKELVNCAVNLIQR